MANNYQNLTRAISRTAIFGVIALVVLLLFGGLMSTNIRSGESAVRYSVFGGTDLEKTYTEGLKVYPPWVSLIRYDLRVQEKLEQMTALTSNGLEITMDVSVRWRPERSTLPELHTTYGQDYYRKLVQPELRSAVRDIVGQYTPEQLYSSKRQELQAQIFDAVRIKAAEQYIIVEAVLLRDIKLPDQIRAAIENKLKEEQEAERYEFTLRKETLEAQRKKIEAEGEAEYQRIIARSLSPEYLRFKGIEATMSIANSPNSKTVIVGSGKDGLPLILGN
ncbi:MAG: prohibitin family protein [Bacteroidetes bacterium]|nr:prohibitin family protein [Bacteroidota bacterium]